MTLKQLFETPMANDMICYVTSNDAVFKGHHLSDGKFVGVDRKLISELEEDYDIIELSIRDNKLRIEI